MSKPLFVPTPKQQRFIDAVCSGFYRFLFYGGAAGGGKTYVGLAILILFCRLFPNSKWCVVRKDYSKLKENTIPSFWKLVPRRFLVKFVRGTAYFSNGSQIIFKGENYKNDKDLTWLDGFECNGFLLEEVQELQEKFFEKAKLRAGRHIIEPMPPIFILCTGNPSQNWSKKVFIKPYKDGTLKPPYFFLPAFMEDNTYLPKDYVEGLDTLDSITYEIFVKGNWDIIIVDRPFAYSFRHMPMPNKDNVMVPSHIGKLKDPLRTMPLYLSFDFNVDPITCVVAQTNFKTFIRFHKEYKLHNSDIYKLCDAIKKDFKGHYFMVTGDAAGRARSAALRDNANYYTIITQELGLDARTQLKVPKSNPLISNNRVLVNAILEKFPSVMFDQENCPFLIEDFQYCEVNSSGEIDKTKDKHKTHLLDGARYFFDTFLRAFVKYKS